MKICRVFLAAILVSVLATSCVKNQLADDSAFQLSAPNLVTSKAYLDEEFNTKLANTSFAQTNLFKGNNFDPNCNFCGSGPDVFFPGQNNELSQLTEQGVALGRALFYDPRLSVNNRVSCGSCHVQSKGFAEDRTTSVGVVGVKTDRNAMGLSNLAFDHGYFWRNDHRALQEQILGPVQTHIEMGINDLSLLESKLAATSYYPALFEAAFGDPAITTERISHAMTQFIARIISDQSTMDQKIVLNGEQGLTPLENHGMMVFTNNCSTCHAVNFGTAVSSSSYDSERPTDARVSNIGLDKADRFAAHAGGFKIPGLRNIALTAPYMHDGRFKTLEEVVEHYSSGIQDNPNLDRRLRTSAGAPMRMHLTPYDKAALVTFLKALTDTSVTTDARFSNPFN